MDPASGPDSADPVNVRVAQLFVAPGWRQYGWLPFAWRDGELWIAVTWPMTPEAERLLAAVTVPIRLFRAEPEAIERAYDRVFGAVSDGAGRRFGDLAVELGKVDAATIVEALSYQQRHGGRLGQILAGWKRLTHWDVAEILAAQRGLPIVNLLQQGDFWRPRPWHLMPKSFWYEHRLVPLSDDGSTLRVATDDPDNPGLARLGERCGRRIQPVLTGQRDIVHALENQYREDDLAVSRDDLARRWPEYSSRRLLTGAQAVWIVGLSLVVLAGLVRAPLTTLMLVSSAVIVGYSVVVGYRFWFVQQATGRAQERVVPADELAALDDRSLPLYSILIPMRDEVEVLPTLTRAIERLDYPKDRLEVLLLMEEDDRPTINAAMEAKLPPYFHIVVVPADEPRTKPKACNYGLQRAHGEFVTIFDAEDIPEPDQLKKAVILFRRGDPKLVCVQAKLSYFNRDQNLLTRWFTAEYAMWFDLYLPALHAAKQPIPLGGSSNHFRTAILREVGGWDPFNVTEDADLGIRLYRAGYRTEVMDSTTYEEANSEFVNWVRQRSRWVKGYLQTWLVHMRNPRTLYRELGPAGFWGMQMALLGTPLMFLLNPLFWAITTLWFATQWLVLERLFPPGIYYLGMLNLLGGNFAFTYLNAMAAAKRGDFDLVPYTLLTPLYWSMMSLAAWKALLQLLTRPSHWEKTMHGLIESPGSLSGLDPEAASRRG
jgi:cellulose synthase/poly-beta-1,6-N-acetylglucosamine synthase-like glycosyltransferase